MNFTHKTISCFIITPAKQGLERFNWYEEFNKDYTPPEIKKHIDILYDIYNRYEDFNDYGYLIVPVDVFHKQIIGMINKSPDFMADDVWIYRFDNKLEMFYKPYFLPCEVESSLKFFGINK
jgi:hypothetical protein